MTIVDREDEIEKIVPELTEYMLLNIDEDDGFVALMDEAGNVREDICLPSEEGMALLRKQIMKAFEHGKETYVSVAEIMGKELIVAFRKVYPLRRKKK